MGDRFIYGMPPVLAIQRLNEFDEEVQAAAAAVVEATAAAAAATAAAGEAGASADAAELAKVAAAGSAGAAAGDAAAAHADALSAHADMLAADASADAAASAQFDAAGSASAASADAGAAHADALSAHADRLAADASAGAAAASQSAAAGSAAAAADGAAAAHADALVIQANIDDANILLTAAEAAAADIDANIGTATAAATAATSSAAAADGSADAAAASRAAAAAAEAAALDAADRAEAAADAATAGQLQADWNQTDNLQKDFIKNKPSVVVHSEIDAASGVVGTDASFRAKLKNAAGTIVSLLASAATAARTWTLPDASGTLALFTDITKANVGLSNVDNTSDLNKPIGTATQAALNGKQATITGAATTITTSNLTAGRALASDGSGKVVVSTATSTELGYLSGVTGAIQTQLNGKQASLGFAPVQQGTGTNQLPGNIVRIGWSSGSKIRLQIDATDYADVWPMSILGNAATASSGITAAADTNSTALATTAWYVGQRGTALPLMNGAAASGTSWRFAGIDHVHPTDTSRASTGANNFGGTQNLQDNLLQRAVLKDCALSGVAKGDSGTSTLTFNYEDGQSQWYTNTGIHAWAFSNWPTAGNEGLMKIRSINPGAFGWSIPTINWMLPTGGQTTNFATYLAALGYTLPTSGIADFMLSTTDGGSVLYGRIV